MILALILAAACTFNGRLPDPQCTPGSINPKLTKTIICSKTFRTSQYRDKETTAKQKTERYADYGLRKPKINKGPLQKCELDHLIPLYLGGSDALANIWPECGDFRLKDRIERRLHRLVCDGRLSLAEAQKAIAQDWTKIAP